MVIWLNRMCLGQWMCPVYFRDRLMIKLGGEAVSRVIPSRKYSKLVNTNKKEADSQIQGTKPVVTSGEG